MDNLEYLKRLGWGQWSTPYSRDRDTDGITALNKINKVLQYRRGKGHEEPNAILRFPRPTVVIFGAQGSGKTSVLESLIGNGFLPKSLELYNNDKPATLCPVLVNLVKVPPIVGCRLTCCCWVEFENHSPHRKEYLDFAEVEQELSKQMEALATQACEDKLISLTYYSSEVTNMTIIDLPGFDFNKASLSEMEKFTKLMSKYLRSPDVLILAVAPANASETITSTLEFVKIIDPLEKRTLLVLSRWDFIQRNNLTIRQIILYHIVNMDLGVVGIKNRTKEEVRDNTSVQDSQVCGENFLQRHYKDFTTVLTGVGVGPRYLVERVCELIIFLWGSRLSENLDKKRLVLSQLQSKIGRRKKLLSKAADDQVKLLEDAIEDLEFSIKVLKDGWKEFGAAGSISRHQELRERFIGPTT